MMNSTKKKGGQKKRVLRAIQKQEPKITENIKKAMFIRGGKTSDLINTLLRDLYHLKKPEAIQLSKRNDFLPFEDTTSLEFLSRSNDSSLFAFGNHSKKRPHNLILGRCFDHHVLDMIELGVENFKGLEDFKTEKAAIGNKPCFLFIGEEFEQKEEFQKLANLLVDLMRGAVVESINLLGLEYIIICFSMPERVMLRTYRIKLKKSGSKIPRIELEEMGPSFDLIIRRTRFASHDLYSEATQLPEQRHHKQKNISSDEFATMGTIHMQREELSTLQHRMVKGLRNKRKSNDSEAIPPKKKTKN